MTTVTTEPLRYDKSPQKPCATATHETVHPSERWGIWLGMDVWGSTTRSTLVEVSTTAVIEQVKPTGPYQGILRCTQLRLISFLVIGRYT